MTEVQPSSAPWELKWKCISFTWHVTPSPSGWFLILYTVIANLRPVGHILPVDLSNHFFFLHNYHLMFILEYSCGPDWMVGWAARGPQTTSWWSLAFPSLTSDVTNLSNHVMMTPWPLWSGPFTLTADQMFHFLPQPTPKAVGVNPSSFPCGSYLCLASNV